jgi:hypothetical protein
MSIPVKLNNIIEEMDIPFEGSFSFLNRKTGEFIFLTSEDLDAAEDEEPIDDLPEWQQENRMAALAVVENEEDYIELPTKFDLNEYEIMESFCLTVSDQRKQESLFKAIKGKGAFRRFKDKVIDFGIEKQWYSYRNEWFKEIAIEWCLENKIDYVE